VVGITVDWTSLTGLGAFVVGVAVGVVLTIRVLHVALDVIRSERSRGDDDDESAQDRP
jgi:hypothetical protein